MRAGRFLAERRADLRRMWLEPPMLAVIAFNLVPVASVLWFGWSAGLLVIFYWIENVVIGVFNAPKIAMCAAGQGDTAKAFSLTPFFILHYGLFTLVHGVFVILIFGFNAFGGGTPGAEAPIWAFLDSAAFKWNIAALLAYHLFDFLFEWVGKKRYLVTDADAQMFSVYPRIIILHLTVLGGAFLLAQIGDPIVGVLLIALFKTVFDVLSKAGRIAKARGYTLEMNGATVSRTVP